MGLMAAAFFFFPGEKLLVVGVVLLCLSVCSVFLLVLERDRGDLQPSTLALLFVNLIFLCQTLRAHILIHKDL